MVVVSNTSPLSNLAIIARLDLLREQFGTVTIPHEVRVELGRFASGEEIAKFSRRSLNLWPELHSFFQCRIEDLSQKNSREFFKRVRPILTFDMA